MALYTSVMSFPRRAFFAVFFVWPFCAAAPEVSAEDVPAAHKGHEHPSVQADSAKDDVAAEKQPFSAEEVIARLEKMKSDALQGGRGGTGGQGDERFRKAMEKLIGPNFKELIEAAKKDEKNLTGLKESWFQSLSKVIQEKKELARLSWRSENSAGRVPLNASDRQRYQTLLKDYQRGAAMNELHTATLGEVYMAVEKKTGFFDSLPPDIRVGHNNSWTGGVGAKTPAAHVFAGDTYLQMKDPGSALGAYRKAVSLDPSNPQAWAGSGAANLELGNYRDAHADASRALQLDPGNMSAVGVVKLSEGRGGAGVSNVSTPQTTGSAAYGRGVMGAGSAGGSGFSFAGAARGPGAAAAARLNDQARGALRMGDPASALELAARALAADASNSLAYYLRSSAYARQSDWSRAAEEAAKGLALAPRNSQLLAARGYALNRAKDYKGAIEAANLALEVDPNDAWAFANRAYAAGGLGDAEAMRADLHRAAQLDAAFQASLAQVVQAPTSDDLLFLFPGESAPAASKASAAPDRKRRFGVLAGTAALGGLLLALGLLSTVLSPLKDRVTSVFTRGAHRSPSVSTLEPVAAQGGGLLRGQFELGKQIGAGGMGLVYEGTDRSLGRRVAVKRMREEIRLDARERARFVSEAKTVAALHHPNIVDIYAVVEEDSDLHLIFEFVEGRTLHELIQLKGRFAPAEAARVVRGAADALDFAHGRGIIHRDMKPSNLMLDGAGRVKVMDFGIARAAKDAMTRFSMTNTIVGTPPYMAPEQEQGQVRKESDVYALAVCAYELLCGRVPFAGSGAGMLMNKINMSYVAPSQAAQGLSPALDEVFARAFQADPERRYRSPGEFAAALEAAVSAPAPSAV